LQESEEVQARHMKWILANGYNLLKELYNLSNIKVAFLPELSQALNPMDKNGHLRVK
jgi:hypothetical protein